MLRGLHLTNAVHWQSAGTHVIRIHFPVCDVQLRYIPSKRNEFRIFQGIISVSTMISVGFFIVINFFFSLSFLRRQVNQADKISRRNCKKIFRTFIINGALYKFYITQVLQVL